MGKRRVAPLPAVPLCADWTDEDRAYLQRFLDTPSGRKFFQRGHALAAQNALQAGKDSVTPIHSAARATGFMDCLNWMLSISVPSTATDGNDAEAQGDTLHREPDLAIT